MALPFADLAVLAEAEAVYQKAKADDLIFWLAKLRNEPGLFPARVQRLLIRSIVRVLNLKVQQAEFTEGHGEKPSRPA